MSMSMWCSERVYVVVLREAPPTDGEWDRFIQLCRRRSGLDVRVLVETHNGGPNAKQRKAIADATRDLDYRAAVLTESLVARGIVTALAWIGVPQRAFAVSDYAHAANYLGLTPSELDLILEELPRIRNSAPPYAIAG